MRFSTPREAAKNGPIVVLYATKLRSDAILVREDSITSIAIPRARLTTKLMVQHLTYSTISPSRGGPNKMLRKLLSWLWVAASAMQPVLQGLGYIFAKEGDGEPTRTLPRVGWIGVGMMEKAPLNAASKY